MLEKLLVLALITVGSSSGNPLMASGEIALLLVLIGAMAMISGALIIRHALNRIAQSNEELFRSWWRVTNDGGILYINHVAAPRDYPRGRPDECKPDASSGKSDRQGSDGKIGAKK